MANELQPGNEVQFPVKLGAVPGQDPNAGQYGHAAIGAPVDQGAAMDRKLLAASASERDLAASKQMPNGNGIASGADMLNSFQKIPMPTIGMRAGGAVRSRKGMLGKESTQKSRSTTKNFVDGGGINGPGGPTDDLVPIMASNGEFMIKAASAKILGEDVLEALNDLGDEPKNPKDDASEDAKEGEGMKCGGKVKKMAGGGLVEDEKTRLSRIPTAGSAAPAYDGQSTDNDFTRNINNNLNSLGGMGVVSSVPLKAAAAATSGLGAIKSSVKAAPMIANGVPGALTSGNLPAMVSSVTPVAKSVNVALQEGALANQAAAATRSLGNASSGLGMMDGQQAPLAKPVTQAAPVQQRTVAAGAIPFKSDAAAMFRNTREADKAITGVTGVTAQPTSPQVQVKTPAELHQEKLAAAQASQGAYAAIPKRGEYSEANTQAYLSALDKSKAMQPSYYSQETPNGAQNRAQADQAANAALANIDSGTVQAPAGAVPAAKPSGATIAQQAAATKQPTATSANPQAAQPTTQPVSAPTVIGADGRQHINEVVSPNDHIKSDAMLNTVFGRRGSGPGADANINMLRTNSGALDTANKAWAMRGAGIQATRDANGGLVLSNSTGPEKMAYADKAGNPTTDYAKTSQYAQGVAQAEKMNAQVEAIDERNAFNQPMSKNKRAAFVDMANSKRAAGALRQTNQLAQDKFNLDATGINLDNQQKVSLMAIQKAMFDPKATALQLAEATKQYMALNGKTQDTLKPFAVTGGQTVIDGQAVTQPSMVFDPTTKQFINPNQGAQQAKAPHAQDIARLKANPKEAAMFEQIYGQGSAQQFLGK